MSFGDLRRTKRLEDKKWYSGVEKRCPKSGFSSSAIGILLTHYLCKTSKFCIAAPSTMDKRTSLLRRQHRTHKLCSHMIEDVDHIYSRAQQHSFFCERSLLRTLKMQNEARAVTFGNHIPVLRHSIVELTKTNIK